MLHRRKLFSLHLPIILFFIQKLALFLFVSLLRTLITAPVFHDFFNVLSKVSLSHSAAINGILSHKTLYLAISKHIQWIVQVHKPHKSIGPDDVHPQVLRELVDDVVKPLSIMSEELWQSGELPTEWKRGNIITLIFKKVKKEDLGKYSPVSLTSVPGKILKQILLETILRPVENKDLTGHSQHGFT